LARIDGPPNVNRAAQKWQSLKTKDPETGGSNMKPEASHYNGCVDFKIRQSRREDFDTLWRIDKECFPPGISYSRLELAVYMRRPRSFTLLAEAAATDSKKSAAKGSQVADSPVGIVGFIVAEANRRGTGHIITIDVLPTARRFGVGSTLLSAAEEHLRAAPCHAVELETAVDNLAALAFYKRHGYDLVKTIPAYYSNGVDALVLRKVLIPASNPS